MTIMVHNISIAPYPTHWPKALYNQTQDIHHDWNMTIKTKNQPNTQTTPMGGGGRGAKKYKYSKEQRSFKHWLTWEDTGLKKDRRRRKPKKTSKGLCTDWTHWYSRFQLRFERVFSFTYYLSTSDLFGVSLSLTLFICVPTVLFLQLSDSLVYPPPPLPVSMSSNLTFQFSSSPLLSSFRPCLKQE